MHEKATYRQYSRFACCNEDNFKFGIMKIYNEETGEDDEIPLEIERVGTMLAKSFSFYDLKKIKMGMEDKTLPSSEDEIKAVEVAISIHKERILRKIAGLETEEDKTNDNGEVKE